MVEVMPVRLFTMTVDYNPYLGRDDDTLWTWVRITATGSVERTAGRAEVVIIDNSGSMGMGRKMAAAKGAAVAAVEALEDGVEFAVVAGNDVASQVWPPGPHLAVADDEQRGRAIRAIGEVQPQGMTSIGSWLAHARQVLEQSSADLRHAILLSDGQNTAGQAHLEAATNACRGILQCDCRGFGTDWSVGELRFVAETLGGQVGLVDRVDEHGGDELAQHFRQLIGDSQARVVPALRLRLITREVSDVIDVVQSTPRTVVLTKLGQPSPIKARALDFPLGGWAPGEVREHTFGIRVRPEHIGRVGEPAKPIAKLGVVLVDDTVESACVLRVEWTNDARLSTRVVADVESSRTQLDITQRTRDGIAARDAGDLTRAADLLWQARVDAEKIGNQHLVDRLDKLVRLDRSGRPVLLEATIAEVMHTDADSGISVTSPRPSGHHPGDAEDRGRSGAGEGGEGGEAGSDV
jgi:hypothetical protein